MTGMTKWVGPLEVDSGHTERIWVIPYFSLVSGHWAAHKLAKSDFSPSLQIQHSLAKINLVFQNLVHIWGKSVAGHESCVETSISTRRIRGIRKREQ